MITNQFVNKKVLHKQYGEGTVELALRNDLIKITFKNQYSAYFPLDSFNKGIIKFKDNDIQSQVLSLIVEEINRRAIVK